MLLVSPNQYWKWVEKTMLFCGPTDAESKCWAQMTRSVFPILERSYSLFRNKQRIEMGAQISPLNQPTGRVKNTNVKSRFICTRAKILIRQPFFLRKN